VNPLRFERETIIESSGILEIPRPAQAQGQLQPVSVLDINASPRIAHRHSHQPLSRMPDSMKIRPFHLEQKSKPIATADRVAGHPALQDQDLGRIPGVDIDPLEQWGAEKPDALVGRRPSSGTRTGQD
jgi:hypothetical protein